MAVITIPAYAGGAVVNRNNFDNGRPMETISVIRAASADQALDYNENRIEITANYANDINNATGSLTQDFGTVGGYIMIAQSFIPDAYAAADIVVKLRKVGTPVDNVTLSICADGGGAPGTIIASTTISPSVMLSSGQLHSIDLRGKTLVPSTKYWIALSRTGSANSTNYYSVYYSNTSAYAQSLQGTNNGTIWATFLGGGLGQYACMYFKYDIYQYNGFGYLSRAFMSFDTSTIPVGSTLISAYVSLPMTPGETDGPSTKGISLTPATPSNRTIGVGQFNQISDTLLAAYITFDLLMGAETVVNFPFPLNSTGLAHINLNGYTDLCMRTQTDIENLPFDINTAYIDENILPESLPSLVVTYTPPPTVPFPSVALTHKKQFMFKVYKRV